MPPPAPPPADQPPPDGEHVRAEDQLAENQARIQTTEALSRFARRTAHSLNNFLMVFSGALDLLEAALDSDPERAQRMLDTLRESVSGTEELIEQLRSIRGPELRAVEDVDLHDIVAELLPAIDDALDKRVEVRLHPAKAAAPTSLDREAFLVALRALVHNAVEASPDDGQVQLRTLTLVVGEDGASVNLGPGVYTVLEVEDAGSGMDADVRARLFEPGYSTKTGTDRGYGLANTWGIVRKHHGCVVIDSEPGRGTLVRVFLPAAGVMADYEAPRDSAEPVRGGRTVLLVDDEPPVLAYVCDVLRHAGFEVLPAADGSSALEIARTHEGDIDLLVTDIMMPGMNGRQVADQFATIRPGTPALFISGFPRGVLHWQGSGVPTLFLAKPFTSHALLARIDTVLRAADDGQLSP